jgi:Xaa-Pro aminopeptidase
MSVQATSEIDECAGRIDALRENIAKASCDAFVSLAPPTNQYLTGFRGSTSGVIVTETQALFLCDFRYTQQAADQVSKGYEVREISGPFGQRVSQHLNDTGALRAAFEPAYTTVSDHADLAKRFDGELVAAGSVVAPLRVRKSASEIAKIEAALQLSERVLQDVTSTLSAGQTERSVAAQLEHGFKQQGATKASFDTISLFGARASLPHGEPGDQELKSGMNVLFDFGCILNGYCSDLTRCYAFGKIPGSWYETIYNLVLEAQLRSIDAIRPGAIGREVDAVARDIITDGGHGDHFGHGLGHGVGIEIHESLRLNPQSETLLEPGMVVTVEPGIYVPGQGGVRIEDVVVVTEDGCRVLSSAPKALEVLGT